MADINWTTVATSGIVAAVISSFQFITTRYLGKLLDKIDKSLRKGR